jgi:outer membrane autotransporter protein
MRERRERMSRTSFYAFGTYGVGQNNDFDNNEGSGATGLFMRLGDDLAVGVGVVSSKSNTELRLGGNSDVETIGGAVNLAYETGEGLRLYATATVTDLSVDMKRNYVNGGGTDSSRGETNGIAYGAAVRAGWSFPVNEKTSVMPYAEVQASRANLDAYTETGGAFPATFNKQTANFVTSRVGAEFSHDLSDNVELRMRAAWGHQWNGDNNTLTGSVLGINQTVPYTTGDKDWAEAGTTVIWQATDRTNFYADLSGRYGKTAEPAAVASFGITIGF